MIILLSEGTRAYTSHGDISKAEKLLGVWSTLDGNDSKHIEEIIKGKTLWQRKDFVLVKLWADYFSCQNKTFLIFKLMKSCWGIKVITFSHTPSWRDIPATSWVAFFVALGKYHHKKRFCDYVCNLIIRWAIVNLDETIWIWMCNNMLAKIMILDWLVPILAGAVCNIRDFFPVYTCSPRSKSLSLNIE